jgi:hypothetical protein
MSTRRGRESRSRKRDRPRLARNPEPLRQKLVLLFCYAMLRVALPD